MSNKPDSTKQLIADAEAMAGAHKSPKAQSTRQLIRDSERLLGRQSDSGAGFSTMAVGIAVILAALAGAAYFLLM